MDKKRRISAVLLTILLLTMNLSTAVFAKESYTVKSGDSLWKISQRTGLSVNELKLLNGLTSDNITAGQVLNLSSDSHLYTVKSGDTLWKISKEYGITVSRVKALNNLSSDSIYIGQSLKTMPDTINYTVKSGDTLYLLALRYSTTISEIQIVNNLYSSGIYPGQVIRIPYSATKTSSQNETVTQNTSSKPTPVYNWPSVTYVVKAGDTASSIAKNFRVTVDNLLKYNYMTSEDWFDEGETIAINGYAPRNYDIYPNMDLGMTTYGHIADWFLDGQYVLKRNVTFKVTDLNTGKTFNMKVMGGYNHADVEPLTSQDTSVMKSLCSEWTWNPRPVVIYVNGMNIAASLSFMPHSYNTNTTNGVTGHFDCYLKNSTSHSSETSGSYIEQHLANVRSAAGY